MIRPFCKYTKRNPFVPSFYIKNYEVIPTVCIAILDVFMFTFWPIRTLFNTDCILSRYTTPPGERYDLLIHPRNPKVKEYYPKQNGNVYVGGRSAATCDQYCVPCTCIH